MHAIPQRCAHRPLAGGLVVPWVTLIHGGHAALGVLDADRARAAFRHRLCQICGQRLNERCFLIVRPADVIKGHSPEPALHPECLPYTAAHCPMLILRRFAISEALIRRNPRGEARNGQLRTSGSRIPGCSPWSTS